MDSPPVSASQEARCLRWIAIYNLGKGLLLCLLAIGILGFLHKDVDSIVGSWMSDLGFNMENRHIIRFLARLDKVTDKQLAEMSGVTFALAGILVTQGTGLLFRQQWAKYVTICFTASFIPFEFAEIHKHFGWLKFALLAVNVVVVGFLAILLVREKRREMQQLAAIPPAPTASGASEPAAVSCESA